MKNTDIKLVAGQILLIGGLAILSIGSRWSFFIGLAVVMISGLLSLRRSVAPRSLIANIIRAVLWIGCMVFLVWFFSFGDKKPPFAALVGVWLGFSIDEFNSWRSSRRLVK
jgi:glucose dehydrogenase